MSVISFSWSHHLSRLTTKRFIKGKGWKIVPPSLRNTYQNINSNSFSHGWAKPTSTRELTASRNVFKASFPCFLPASLHIKELIYIIAPLRPFINFSSSAELCQHDAAAHGTVRHMSTKDNVDALEDAPQSRSDCGIQHLTRQHYSKIWGGKQKKARCGENKQAKRWLCSQNYYTISVSSITAPGVLDWRRASAACGQLEWSSGACRHYTLIQGFIRGLCAPANLFLEKSPCLSGFKMVNFIHQ